MDNIQMAVETITPEVAEEMLLRNVSNRPASHFVVGQYARDMKAGKWDVTGEAIKFDVDGQLLDGQHRLKAVMASKATIKSVVIRGISNDAKVVMDTGKGRTTRDALALVGETNCTDLAACVRAAIGYQSERKQGGGNRISNHEVVGWLGLNPDMRDAVRFVNGKSQCRRLLTPRVMGLSRFITFRIDPIASDSFFSLIEVPPQDTTHPCFVLSRTISNARISSASSRGGDINYDWLVGITAKAWNAYINKKPIKMLKFPRGSDCVKFMGPTKNFTPD